MKKVVNLITIIFILLLFYLTRNSDILSLSISFSMYILLGSLFSTTRIKDKNYKLFKLSILSIVVLGLFFAIISYFIGDILNIDKLNIINIFMVMSLIANVMLKMIRDYLEIINYNRLRNKMFDIVKIIMMIIKIVLCVILFGIFRLYSYVSVILLYSVDIVMYMIISVLLYFNVFNKIKETNRERINYVKELKKVLVDDKMVTILNVIKSSYIYISIIILYYVLGNKYNYSYDNISYVITNNYFYGLIVVYYIYVVIKKYLNINVKDDFNFNVNKVIKLMLPLTILFIIISKPLSYVIFGSENNILANLIPLLSFYLLYDFIINNNLYYNKNKNVIITLVVGLFIKFIFELPLIDTIYRMGYNLALGSILSNVLGFVVSVVIGIIFLKKKLKLNLLNNFNNLLNIVYENMIYSLIIVLFTLIVDIDTNSFVSSLLVIIFYIFISILFYIVKIKFNKKLR